MSVSIAKGTNGGFIVTIGSTIIVTDTIKYRTGNGIEIYDSLDKLIYSGNPAEFSIVINGTPVTSFTTISQVVAQLDLLIKPAALGNVSVIDGGSVTLGAKADAKSTATDATPISEMSVLKQISASVQVPPQQKIIRTFKATITLGANQNPYAPGDVILDTGGVLGVWDMSAQTIKTSATILGVRVQTTDATGLASKNLKFHVFNDSVTPIADNAAFAIADANEGKREGTIALVMGSGTTSKVGQSNYENIALNPVAGKIHFILEDVDGHTPSANSTVIYCYIKVELGN